MSKILALDLSTKSTGCAILNKETKFLDGFYCFTASSSDVIKRIKKITQEIKKILINYKDIDTIVLEEVRPNDFGSGVGNLHTQKVLMWLQGAVVMMLHDELPTAKIEYIYPSEWRSACGISTGRGLRRTALKSADISFVKKHFQIDVNDDIADAICIAIGFLNKKQEEQNQDNEINWE
ncbi:MAG: hypothetical protein MSA65_03560 [Mollicutes bacterium]|nr:hypothetical protein [Mollicutes bacterium]